MSDTAENKEQKAQPESTIPHIGSKLKITKPEEKTEPSNDTNETSDSKEQNEEHKSDQSNQGTPSVKAASSGNNTVVKIAFVVLAVILLVAVVLGFLYYKGYLKFGSQDMAPVETEQSTVGLTSKNELTRVEIPKPEAPTKEVENTETTKEPTAKEMPMPMPMPMPAAAVAVDAKGNPIPTLEELKFAAPMMGSVGETVLRGSQTNGGTAAGTIAGTGAMTAGAGMGGGNETQGTSLTDMLKPVHTPSKNARVIKNQSLTLSKGTVIECILETRVDTSVPGMASCVVPRNIFSMDGRTLLIEKGTKAIGEYQGAVQNGLARIFMLWTELRTPNGVSIALNSPTTDSLGGAGMGGYVDFHWWQRFGNALLFSMISDGFQYVVNNANRNNTSGDITYNNTTDGVDEIIKEAMAQSGNIPPTLIKNQGERVAIFVARDLNFNSVYSLSK